MHTHLHMCTIYLIKSLKSVHTEVIYGTINWSRLPICVCVHRYMTCGRRCWLGPALVNRRNYRKSVIDCINILWCTSHFLFEKYCPANFSNRTLPILESWPSIPRPSSLRGSKRTRTQACNTHPAHTFHTFHSALIEINQQIDVKRSKISLETARHTSIIRRVEFEHRWSATCKGVCAV